MILTRLEPRPTYLAATTLTSCRVEEIAPRPPRVVDRLHQRHTGHLTQPGARLGGLGRGDHPPLNLTVRQLHPAAVRLIADAQCVLLRTHHAHRLRRDRHRVGRVQRPSRPRAPNSWPIRPRWQSAPWCSGPQAARLTPCAANTPAPASAPACADTSGSRLTSPSPAAQHRCRSSSDTSTSRPDYRQRRAAPQGTQTC
jgi:hypothetical protein